MTAIVAAFVLLLWLSLVYLPFRWRPVGIFLFVEKVFALACLPFIVVAGAGLALMGRVVGSWWLIAPAGIAALGALAVMLRIGSVRTDLSGALGSEWRQRIGLRSRERWVSRWWTGPLPKRRDPRLSRDVPFATIPDSARALLCDVWQPPAGAPCSGVAVVYLHGSAYYVLDKDCGTRPLFRQWTAQGHVVVDVAYRLFPETDVVGMVGDAKRAVAWVRGHARDLGVDRDRIVLVGGSAGGHLALLAAYGHADAALTPAELAGADVRVSAVVSLYGQVGLDTLYRHTSQDEICHSDDPRPDFSAPPSRALTRLFGNDAARLRLGLMACAGRCDWLVGGTPSEVPERYARVSVFRYVRPDCPPTLLVHGTHDEMAPVGAVRELEHRLEQTGVAVTAVYLPHTDHMFDLVAPRWSPAARVAVHLLERFLAGIATRGEPVQANGERRAVSSKPSEGSACFGHS
jgi:acetyl esterase/lipase